MLALVLAIAAAQPRLGVVDATPAGAPDLFAAVLAAAGKLGRFDVEPADTVDAAVAEARKVGAACAFDDGPECWARLGILSELDRILVIRKNADTMDLLLVDVPARTAARASTPLDANPKASAEKGLAALLSGQPVTSTPKAPEKPKVHGAVFTAGLYTGAFGAVLLAGCGGGALGVSAQLASKLVAARDIGAPLDNGYRGLNTAFIGLSICAGVATAAGVGGVVAVLAGD